ncbi:unnamed protein product [Ilex paraguariensis]|uniref:J domain-containing protein n=1 Tax=Ilex paraguariensis TaxID=185542 RepID=A0ABC8SCU7_9AQUA
MCCNYGVISRSDLRFSLLPPPTATLISCHPHPFPRLAYRTHRPLYRIFLHTRSVSFTTKATINDASVTSPPPPLSEFMSFYDLLGIPETGTLLEIKQAYKQLARKYHPDVSPPDRVDEYTRRFIRVQEAYETLSDPNRRASYDRDMAKGLHLAFSARRRFQNHEMEEKSEWKIRWQSQLSELKRRSMKEDTGENMSWAARMRRQRNESST